jgi:hypothetical protein
MKTSKIIFISLLSFIALIILVATISVRITGQKKFEPDNTYRTINISLPEFYVLDVEMFYRITLMESSSSYIELTVPKDSPDPKLNYNVKNDTLHIMNFQNPVLSSLSIKIHIAPGLHMIQLKNSDILLEKYNTPKLPIILDNSKLFSLLNSKENNSIAEINVTANNMSSIYLYSMDIDSANIVLRNSTAVLKIAPKYLGGNLTAGSRLNTIQPGEISLKCDSTSRIFINVR